MLCITDCTGLPDLLFVEIYLPLMTIVLNDSKDILYGLVLEYIDDSLYRRIKERKVLVAIRYCTNSKSIMQYKFMYVLGKVINDEETVKLKKSRSN
jgi:hypothetical protein